MIEARHQAEGGLEHALPPGLLHDLRTPLNQIIGYSELLLEQAEEAGQDDLVPDLGKVRAAGQHLLALINDHFRPLGAPDGLAVTPAKAEKPAAPGEPEAAAATSTQPPAVAKPDSHPGRGSLLVVDDIEPNRDMLSRQLERLGHAVATAGNGQEALAMLGAAPFDLVLLDIMMPEMDGYEVLQRLKADDRLRDIPVVMISALNELESVARCIELGAEDYLPKPFNPTLLKARVGACLGKKRAHDRERQLFEELQQNYQRLQALQELRDALTRMIVHDLRTPLTSLMGGLALLPLLGEMNDQQQELVGIANTGGQALLEMINTLLDVEKMEAGAMQLDYAALSAAELVESAVSQVAGLLQGRELALVTRVAEGLGPFQGDEDKLRRTLVNLLGNAIKFTDAGGTVTVAARAADDGGALLFSVSDTGEGIPADALGRIFQKFGQVESRQRGRKMSTGLGLTFCKLAVEAHGGTLTVVSTPGEGSTFSFTVPLAPR